MQQQRNMSVVIRQSFPRAGKGLAYLVRRDFSSFQERSVYTVVPFLVRKILLSQHVEHFTSRELTSLTLEHRTFWTSWRGSPMIAIVSPSYRFHSLVHHSVSLSDNLPLS
jgi:hypothetical protein